MKFLLALAIAFAILTQGCFSKHYGDHYTVIIDPAFTTQWQQAIIDAIDDWQSKVPVQLDTQIGHCSDINDGVICIHSTTWTETQGKCQNTGPSIGCTQTKPNLAGDNIDGGEIWLAADYNFAHAWDPQQDAEHEIGHAMGLLHEECWCLMNPWQSDGAPNARPADIDQWFSIRGKVAPLD